MDSATTYGSFAERFRFVSSHDDPKDPRLSRLDMQMREFYMGSAVEQGYFEQAESGNQDWLSGEYPFQGAVLERVKAGDMVAEFSCGNGYASRFFAARGGQHIGFDLAHRALVSTKRRHGGAQLLAGNGYFAPLASATADVVASFFVIEHIVWPHRFLDEMVRVARRGGLVALAFPDHIANPSRSIGSIRLGSSPGGVRAKARRGRMLDAAHSVMELKLAYPRYARRMRREIYERGRTPFFINLSPACLVAPYASDNDAVYFASEEEISNYLKGRGCEILARSAEIVHNGKSMDAKKSGNGFVLARRL